MRGCSGRRISAEPQANPFGRGSGSGDMERFKTPRNVWGAEEAFLSPPDQYSGSLAAYTESEESSEDCEDYVCGLAEEIAQSMLLEQEAEGEQDSLERSGLWGSMTPKSTWSSSDKTGSSPTSPQSILLGVGSYQWEARRNKGSSGMPSSTPPDNGSMGALCEELLRVRLEDEVRLASQQRMLPLQQRIIRRPLPLSSHALRVPSSSPSYNACGSVHTFGRRPPRYVSPPRDNVLALAIDRAMMARQGRQQARSSSSTGGTGGVSAEVVAGRGKQAVGLSPQRQQRRGGGGGGGRKGEQQHFSLFASNEGGPMRAVFLAAPASRDCGGTGVFLPRRQLGSTGHHPAHDAKRKPACSTVLLPPHIVQALNLNLENTLPLYPRRDPVSSSDRFRHATPVRNYNLKREEEIPSYCFPLSHSTTLQEVAPNISLPSEWTY